MKNLSKLEDYFDCSNLDENHELFSNVNKVFVKSKNATPKSLWIDKLCMLMFKDLNHTVISVVVLLKIKE